jgi:hypothetical protein
VVADGGLDGDSGRREMMVPAAAVGSASGGGFARRQRRWPEVVRSAVVDSAGGDYSGGREACERNATSQIRPACPTQPKLGSILFDNVGSKWCVSTSNYGGRDWDRAYERIVGQSLGNDGEEALDGI